MKSSSPTIRDVAALAGVSHQTVSRVINGSRRVADETRNKVLDAIETLDYRPNAVARSMVHGKTKMLAFFAPDLIDFTHASILHAAEAEARRLGFFLMGSAAPNQKELKRLIDQLIQQRRVDGLVVLNPDINGASEIIPDDTHVIYICGKSPAEDNRTRVYLDNHEGAVNAIRHLVALGHTKIGMVTGPMEQVSSQFRQKGFKTALNEAGIQLHPEWIHEGDWSATSGYNAFNLWKKNSLFPSAIFSQNDRMAIGIIRAARDIGVRVPEDLSVIGFDDMPLASYFDPPLTTMRQDMASIGRSAIALLVESFENGQNSPNSVCFQAELVIRKSTSSIIG
ncbi:MAG: LacI family DNA-binding transcriptional regulator [Anaerolineaceae bacterium]|nr:LacI family DNA-binding transcriptional regulator [Anaerolineaceae bacterium]